MTWRWRLQMGRSARLPRLRCVPKRRGRPCMQTHRAMSLASLQPAAVRQLAVACACWLEVPHYHLGSLTAEQLNAKGTKSISHARQAAAARKTPADRRLRLLCLYSLVLRGKVALPAGAVRSRPGGCRRSSKLLQPSEQRLRFISSERLRAQHGPLVRGLARPKAGAPEPRTADSRAKQPCLHRVFSRAEWKNMLTRTRKAHGSSISLSVWVSDFLSCLW